MVQLGSGEPNRRALLIRIRSRSLVPSTGTSCSSQRENFTTSRLQISSVTSCCCIANGFFGNQKETLKPCAGIHSDRQLFPREQQQLTIAKPISTLAVLFRAQYSISAMKQESWKARGQLTGGFTPGAVLINKAQKQYSIFAATHCLPFCQKP